LEEDGILKKDSELSETGGGVRIVVENLHHAEFSLGERDALFRSPLVRGDDNMLGVVVDERIGCLILAILRSSPN
jgi:hypothetical protein